MSELSPFALSNMPAAVATAGLLATWAGLWIRWRRTNAENEVDAGENYAHVIQGMRTLMDQQRLRIDDLERREANRSTEITNLRQEVARLVVQESTLRRELSLLRGGR